MGPNPPLISKLASLEKLKFSKEGARTNIKPIDEPLEGKYDAIILAVAHDEFKALSEEEIRAYGKKKHVLYDIKYLLKAEEVDGRL